MRFNLPKPKSRPFIHDSTWRTAIWFAYLPTIAEGEWGRKEIRWLETVVVKQQYWSTNMIWKWENKYFENSYLP